MFVFLTGRWLALCTERYYRRLSCSPSYPSHHKSNDTIVRIVSILIVAVCNIATRCAQSISKQSWKNMGHSIGVRICGICRSSKTFPGYIRSPSTDPNANSLIVLGSSYGLVHWLHSQHSTLCTLNQASVDAANAMHQENQYGSAMVATSQCHTNPSWHSLTRDFRYFRSEHSHCRFLDFLGNVSYLSI